MHGEYTSFFVRGACCAFDAVIGTMCSVPCELCSPDVAVDTLHNSVAHRSHIYVTTYKGGHLYCCFASDSAHSPCMLSMHPSNQRRAAASFPQCMSHQGCSQQSHTARCMHAHPGSNQCFRRAQNSLQGQHVQAHDDRSSFHNTGIQLPAPTLPKLSVRGYVT